MIFSFNVLRVEIVQLLQTVTLTVLNSRLGVAENWPEGVTADDLWGVPPYGERHTQQRVSIGEVKVLGSISGS